MVSWNLGKRNIFFGCGVRDGQLGLLEWDRPCRVRGVLASMSRALSSGFFRRWQSASVVSAFYSELTRKICFHRGPIQLYNSDAHSGLRAFRSSQRRACRFLPTVELRPPVFHLTYPDALPAILSPSLHVAAAGSGSFHSVPSRSIAHSFTRSLRATATMAIFFRLSLPRRTCS